MHHIAINERKPTNCTSAPCPIASLFADVCSGERVFDCSCFTTVLDAILIYCELLTLLFVFRELSTRTLLRSPEMANNAYAHGAKEEIETKKEKLRKLLQDNAAKRIAVAKERNVRTHQRAGTIYKLRCIPFSSGNRGIYFSISSINLRLVNMHELHINIQMKYCVNKRYVFRAFSIRNDVARSDNCLT